MEKSLVSYGSQSRAEMLSTKIVLSSWNRDEDNEKDDKAYIF